MNHNLLGVSQVEREFGEMDDHEADNETAGKIVPLGELGKITAVPPLVKVVPIDDSKMDLETERKRMVAMPLGDEKADLFMRLKVEEYRRSGRREQYDAERKADEERESEYEREMEAAEVPLPTPPAWMERQPMVPTAGSRWRRYRLTHPDKRKYADRAEYQREYQRKRYARMRAAVSSSK